MLEKQKYFDDVNNNDTDKIAWHKTIRNYWDGIMPNRVLWYLKIISYLFVIIQ
jgi:hypothetical protein